MSTSPVGQSVQRIDIRTKVRGTRKYPQDFNRPEQLYGAVVWSAFAHARVKRIDSSAAEAMPGVVRVITAQDVPVNEYGINTPDQPVLVPEGGKVRWRGDRLAIVVAESERQARQAAVQVQVEYEPLPVLDHPYKAMEEGAPLVHEEREGNILQHIRVRKGDWEAGFEQADVVIEDSYSTHYVEHAYLQPDAALGYIDGEGRVTVIHGSQWPHDDLHQIAHLLDLPLEQVREIVPAIGGAFGGREDMHVQHLAALGAFVLRRPVKIVFDREEVTQYTGKRHPFYFRYKMGATRDGRLVAAEIEAISDAGAYASTSVPVLSNAVSFMFGPYRIPNAKMDGYAVHTNNAVTMAMRGFGATQPPVAYEQMMDQLAEALGLDPVEFRLKNVLVPGDETVLGNIMPACTGARESLSHAARAAGWREDEEGHWQRPEVGPASGPHKRRGIGLATAYKNVGYSFGFEDKSSVDVQVRLAPSGQIDGVTLSIGAADVGQGVHTVLQQIAAETLGIEAAQVRLGLVDTANVPDAGSSSASRQTYMSGNAVLRACEIAREKWQQALRDESGQDQIEASYTYYGRSQRETTDFDPETGQCEPHISYTFSTQVALLEVDVETGEVEILKMWDSSDCGRVVNPQMVFGQVAGGVHMGVGYALTEDFVQEEGRARTRRFSEYSIPTIQDMPREFECLPVEVLDPTGPFGAKGLGETPTMPTAPAILNAIAHATGVRLRHLPATPERVWRVLRGE
ncbi:MAG: xanthine dehydrogenase family protein molybdopterin-binding subunit [Chloroflexia bacterium]|nr:xanthine dehydrogenase family protein molybdopterin-binding subunit [Chloroflexia bacterium]